MKINNKQIKDLCNIATFGETLYPVIERHNMRYFIKVDFYCFDYDIRKMYNIPDIKFVDILLHAICYTPEQPSEVVLTNMVTIIDKILNCLPYYNFAKFRSALTLIKTDAVESLQCIQDRKNKKLINDGVTTWITAQYLNDTLGNIPDEVLKYAAPMYVGKVKYFDLTTVKSICIHLKNHALLISKLNNI